MKNYTKLLFQRVVVVSLCILVQAAFLIHDHCYHVR